MRWDDTYQGSSKMYNWHDLLNERGSLLGYVRQTVDTNHYVAQINDRHQDTKTFDNLEDAKGHIVAYYVAQKLEGT